jgi:hypothetical protein
MNDFVQKNREQKAQYKAAQVVATTNRRKNRDEDMDYFAIYYKQRFVGMKFIDFKKEEHMDRQIRMMLLDSN